MEQCLYGTCSNNVAGFCKHHNCSLTVKQMRSKKCISKGCWYLHKNEDHEFWKQRERLKHKKKAKKKEFNTTVVYGFKGDCEE